jgi:hypothetical protein
MTHAEAAAPVPPSLPAPRQMAQPRTLPAMAAAVEPAAGPAPVQNDPAMSTMPDDADVAAAPPAPVASAPIPAPVIRRVPELPALAAASAARVAGANPTTLENLLTTAGVDAKFKPADGNVRQWVSGSVNGMYEQLPAGDFVAQAQSYIDRYRQDCPGGLTVNMGQPQTTAAGTFAEANVSCTMQTNSYNTSFVFVQDQKKFSAILHTGYPEDAAKVRSMGDNVAYALGASGGLTALSSTRKAEATSMPVYTAPAPAYQAPVYRAPVDAAPVQRHFNIPGAQPSEPSYSGTGSASFGARSDDGLETVVVQ